MNERTAAEICAELKGRLEVPANWETVGLDWDQIQFILDLVANRAPAERKIDTLEIGLGIGCSAGAFLLSGRSRRHLVVNIDDPERQKLALENVRKFDADGVFELCEESSHTALPRLAAEGARFDVALIDGNHRFDDIFVDFHYVRSLLRPGGFALLDDLWMPSTKTVVSWIETNLSFEWERLRDVPGNFGVLRKRDVADRRRWFDFTPFDTAWASAQPGRSAFLQRRLDRTAAAICRLCRRSYVRIRPKTRS